MSSPCLLPLNRVWVLNFLDLLLQTLLHLHPYPQQSSLLPLNFTCTRIIWCQRSCLALTNGLPFPHSLPAGPDNPSGPNPCTFSSGMPPDSPQQKSAPPLSSRSTWNNSTVEFFTPQCNLQAYSAGLSSKATQGQESRLTC